MKISLKWLSNYLEVKEFFAQPQKLDEILTAVGLEVENMENLSECFNNVVVGSIKELDRHPNADKLTLCQVDVGEGSLRPIICGAENHKQGDCVVVALPGAVLPGDFKIKKSKIRGVESAGMLCSESELGLSDKSEGIKILEPGAVEGKGFAEYASFDDIIFELSVTPNRADCLSHIGLARELAALLDKKIDYPDSKIKTGNFSTKNMVGVEVKQLELCPRYAGRLIRGVQVGPSPTWLKSSLEALGLKSINNIVDVTNYVMMEYGQPLHAFDLKFLNGQKIIIDKAKAGESFTTLDGTEIQLSGDELTIRDDEKVVALAGIVGGKNCGVEDSTTDVFLEVAHFVPQTVRKTSRRYGIDTDSGYRFSRGTDPEAIVEVMSRACHLIQQVAGGIVAEDYQDEYPTAYQAKAISVSQETLEDRLGYDVPMNNFDQWMQRLGCKVDIGEGCLLVTPPTYRWDLELDVDLVEEYGRLHGYDKIPDHFPALVSPPLAHDVVYTQGRYVNEVMNRAGFMQSLNYSFIANDFLKTFIGDVKPLHKCGLKVTVDPVFVKNPISEDLNVMRTLLTPGLVKNLLHNYRYGNELGRIFETGFVFEKTDQAYRQSHHLACLTWGQSDQLWDKASSRPLVYDLKSSVEFFLGELKSQAWSWNNFDNSEVPQFLHPAQSAVLFYEGKNVGFIGTLHPKVAQENKIRVQVALAEFNLEALMRGQPRTSKIKRFGKFPVVERDLAFLVPESTSVSEILLHIKKAVGAKLQEVKVFDLYKGKELPEGHQSISFKMVYQDQEGTLTEGQLTELQQLVVQRVTDKLGIKVR